MKKDGEIEPSDSPLDEELLANAEEVWTASFQATSADQWERLAALARREIEVGDTIPIEDVFPVKSSGE